MPRKITSGVVGGPVLGSLSSKTNTFESVETNSNIVFTPDGTGVSQFTKDLFTSGEAGVRFGDGDTNYALLKAPNALSANYTLTLPTNDGDANQILQTNGSGVLSWQTSGLTVTNRTAADTNDYYLAMVDTASVTSGNEDTLSVANNNRLKYNPNTALLTVGDISASTITASTVDINGGAVDGTAVGANSRSTGAFTTLAANSTVSITATTTARQLNPQTNNTYDLGTNALRWRNIYTNDLHLSNGIGDYTVVEGEEDLFLYNNKSNKVFKFALIEVDASEAPAKAKEDR